MDVTKQLRETAEEWMENLTEAEVRDLYVTNYVDKVLAQRALEWEEKWHRDEKERHRETLIECGRLQYEVEQLRKLVDQLKGVQK